jgi:hypothetical protein
MKTIPQRFAEIVIKVARTEDLALRSVGKGVLRMPETAFAYAVGSAVALEASSVFGPRQVKWLPENSLGPLSGRTDLVFDVGDERGLAVEFKIGGTWESYCTDISKLAAVDPNRFDRVFCGLVDAWPKVLFEDPRIKRVEERFQSQIMRVGTSGDSFDFFATLHSSYKNQICCIVAMWQLLDSFRYG